MQRIWVFQQGSCAEGKIQWIKQHGKDLEIARVISIEPPLAPVIDEPESMLPADIDADLVLDYLRHPDLTHNLALQCHRLDIPLVALGCRLQIQSLFTPPVCCGLGLDERLGTYGRQFGAPILQASVRDNCIAHIEVLRGSPCGSSWKAARKVAGLDVSEAVTRFGLEIQLHCQANPAGWDPVHGKSPVHVAGQVHTQALKKPWNKQSDHRNIVNRELLSKENLDGLMSFLNKNQGIPAFIIGIDQRNRLLDNSINVTSWDSFLRNRLKDLVNGLFD